MSHSHFDGRRAVASVLEPLENRQLLAAGFATAAPAYLTPSATGVQTQPLLTVGDSVGGYRLVGIPDGLGAFDNGNGTFTVLMNHELRNTGGIVRAHGSKGAFVSKWVIDKATKTVLSGEDLIKTVNLWDAANSQYVSATTAFNRFCSADLPALTAFYNSASGLGTTERIFMNGEENIDGRAFAHVVSSGATWELPWLGKFAWENALASPYAQDKTIVMGMDDSSRSFTSENPILVDPSELYIWVGNKKNAGSVVDKAGLTDGILHGLRVGLTGAYDANESTVTSGERFELVALSNQGGKIHTQLQAETTAAGITQFRRIEDGHWDTRNANVFYFTTTDQFGGTPRVWKLTFDDIKNPTAGGKIEIAVDSPAGVAGEMFDNMTINTNGDLLLQEDPGNQDYIARVWEVDSASGNLIQIAQHNAELFTPGSSKFITRDEESSGIIELADILGPGYYLADVQAHYAINAANPRGFANPDELVEGGQLLIIKATQPIYRLNEEGVLNVLGAPGADKIHVSPGAQGKVNLFLNDRHQGAFAAASVVVSGGAGNDWIDAAAGLTTPVEFHGQDGDDLLVGGKGDDLLEGGWGNDRIQGRDGNDILVGAAGDDRLRGDNGNDLLIGGAGADWLYGGNDDDILIGGATSFDAGPAALRQAKADPAARLKAGVSVFNDASVDWLWGDSGNDWFFASVADKLADKKPGEVVDLI